MPSKVHDLMRAPRVLALSAAALALAGLACSSIGGRLATATPTSSLSTAGSGLVAFVGADHNVYTFDPATREKTAVTDDAAVDPSGPSVVYDAPAWAPQTDQLAFTRTRIGVDGSHHVDLMAGTVSGGQTEAVFSDTSRTPFYIYWSPDGKTLSFLASRTDGSLGAYIRREGEGAQLLDQGQPYYWVWTPDGASLLAHVGGSAADNPAGARLSLFQGEPLQGSQLDVRPSDFQAPDVAPDGKHMVVAGSAGSGTSTLDILDLATGSVTHAFDLVGPVGFGWSPSGDSIAYITLPGTGQDTFGSLGWVDMTDPGRPRQITDVASHVAGFFWSPVGDRLAYLVPELVTPGNQQPVAFGAQSGQLMLNLYVAVANTRTVDKVVSFAPTDAFLAVLPFFDQYERSMSIWSPDGRQLVYAASAQNGPPGVYIVNADGSGSPRRVADGNLAVWSWR